MLENLYKLLYKIKNNNIVDKNNNKFISKYTKSKSRYTKFKAKSRYTKFKAKSKHTPENTNIDEDLIDNSTIIEQQKILEKLIIRQARRKIELQ